jgi:hypothetical protein
LSGATITLTLGQFSLSHSVVIDASMLPLGITIDADDPSTDLGDGTRIFYISDPTSGSSPPLVAMIGLTLTGGDAWSDGASSESDGGAIRCEARLRIEDCTISGNTAARGGGIFSTMLASSASQVNALEIKHSQITGCARTSRMESGKSTSRIR